MPSQGKYPDELRERAVNRPGFHRGSLVWVPAFSVGLV